ncbi:DNA-directed DNA polymerase NDAI_0K01260 [Naumovozyma dairenensis CBS 421]|uniref:DNA polymerase n=1 Tax=Naumovozyma dairenensis (strain ATCC 10597 / BCRC 20456 / CBS 421 / NBRC 0211 / NRRL Y-12639) TaxID=1071378 RepID=G0WHQ6_NAUDC|nr:hypothetical protein NDAI_0K01260 [Naumovozyma dairenensis CBS 421]CCD27317.1 hypothetical protein NDAI_0K01260 [Naumovozyma dairenensis CBS 421]
MSENNFSLDSSLSADFFNIQLNDYDFYMTKPTVLDKSHGISLPLHQFNQVPVIRIYGNLPTGHQVLCHVHGVTPYIFVEYDGKLTDSSVVLNQKCTQLHTQLEQIVFDSMKNNNKKTTGMSLDYISNVSVVKAVPFYGFHVGWQLFYKISILNPSFVNRIADIIRDGKLLIKKDEVFEAHIPYLLQFSADYNLFGCDWIKLKKCHFRKPLLNPILDIDRLTFNLELKTILERFCNQGENAVLLDKGFQRIGNGLLEIDILPQYIYNREELQYRDLHHNFVEKLEDVTSILQGPYVSSTRKMVKETINQRQLFSLPEYRPIKETERLHINTEWQSSDIFRKFYESAKNNQISMDGKYPTFETFVENIPTLEKLPRPFEALDELWPTIPTKITGAAEGEIDKSNLELIDTSFEAYSLLDLTDDDANNVTTTSSPRKPEKANVEKIHDNKLPDDLSSNSSENAGTSMDFKLTQSMAKKRTHKIKFNQILNIEGFKDHPLRSGVGVNANKRLQRNIQGIPFGSNAYSFKKFNLDFEELEADLMFNGFPRIDYSDPFYSNPIDLNTKPYIYAGRRFRINSTHLSNRHPLPFQDEYSILEHLPKSHLFSIWKYSKKPPTFQEVGNISTVKNTSNRSTKSQIEGATPKHKYYFSDPSIRKKKGSKIYDSLTHLSLETHINTRGDKRPDPKKDEVTMITWCIEDESFPFDLNMETEGIMVVLTDLTDTLKQRKFEQAARNTSVAFYETEFDMFEALTDLILLCDPDIISGFEVHMSSWGYIIERCNIIHKFDILEEISRVHSRWKKKSKDIWGYTHSSGISVTGRHVINIWRALRSEMNLTQYTIENITYNVLRERLPHFSYQSLTDMWNDNCSISNLKTVINYWLLRTRLNIKLLQKQEFIPKTIEQARLIGIDFNSVSYRGSQYKVESFLIRICKSESFLLLAPGKKQVRKQKALECVPLVMEPESSFYKSPLVVLDFQSLYPSIITAYNYCYSTMLGRVRELKTFGNEIGVTNINIEKNLLRLLENDVTIAPNGMVYLKPSVRKSTLAKMLTEILDIRVMVKKTMSDLSQDNNKMKKLLNNKQLALKLLANVTYGYTSASFSGRMPCSDLADSVVQTGRETLEKAIKLIEANEKWSAKVVYGDTDSLFVYLPGRTKDEAFLIGGEMAKAVTDANPAPVFLKFEKVYHPSILISKKRYVGYSYESSNQVNPSFDAKGIETVRRDGHPAQQKITEKALKILFDTKDLSHVKNYVQDQFTKIQEGRVSIQDFCFAKEVKLGTYKSDKTAPAGAIVATKMMERDPRARAQYRERVPYLVIKGKSGQILRERSISPWEFLQRPDLELDSEYYITKTLVPPLSRLFNLIGIDVFEWATELSKYKKGHSTVNSNELEKLGASILCVNCGAELTRGGNDSLCDNCQQNKLNTASTLLCNILERQDDLKKLELICRTCSYRYNQDAGMIGHDIANRCESYDCPIYFSRIKARKYLQGNITRRKEEALENLDTW